MSADAVPPDRLRTALERAASVAGAPPSVEHLHRRLRARRRRRTALTAGAAALSVVAVAATATLVAGDRPAPAPAVPGPTASAAGARGWTPLPPSPLGARHGSLAVVVGDEVLVLGGRTDPICPPTANCVGPSPAQQLRDGAAYDVGEARWRRLAEAPVPPAGGAVAVVGDVVHLLVDDRHLGYDLSDDRWSELPAPPGEDGHRPTGLAAAGDVLVAWQVQTDRPDLVFDPSDGTWAPLPGDPLAPSFDRQYVWTGTALVLLAAELTANPGGDGPSLQQAAVLDLDTRSWRELPAATDTVTGSLSWSWDGRRVLAPASGFVDGGEVGGYGRSYSTGGALDPVAGTWSLLPPPPAATPGVERGFEVGVDSRRWKASAGALLDTTTDTWTGVPPAPAQVQPYGAQAWVGDVLVAWGGGRPFGIGDGDRGELVATGAVLRP